MITALALVIIAGVLLYAVLVAVIIYVAVSFLRDAGNEWHE